MKISLYTRISDLTPVGETFFDHINDWLFRDKKREMFRRYSLDSIFQPLKKAGLEGLELVIPTHLSEQNVKTIIQISQKYDLKIFSIHQSHDTYLKIDLAEIERLCGIAKTFSASVIVLHINALGKRLSEQTFLTELKGFQKKYNVNFGIENMPKSPFTFAKSMYREIEFSTAINQSGLSMTLDTTHVGQVKENIITFYKKNKDKIVNIHIGDYNKSWLNRLFFLTHGTHLPIGKGKLPIAEFFRILKEDNYQGPITMEIGWGLKELCQSTEIIKDAFK